jgi:DNA invertase Pin-like site-specific DNA recombinase
VRPLCQIAPGACKNNLHDLCKKYLHEYVAPACRTRYVIAMASDEGLLIGYARVSTQDQNLDLQRDALAREGVKPGRIYSDKASGGPGVKRPGFAAAMKACRKGDTLVVWKLDRLGRSLMEVLDVCQRLEKRGAGLRVITDKIDTTTAMGRFVLHILAALAEMERGLIIERTKAGLAAAKARGRVGGRRRIFTDKQRDAALAVLRAGGSVPEAAKAAGCSPSLVYQRIRAEGDWAAFLAEGAGK